MTFRNYLDDDNDPMNQSVLIGGRNSTPMQVEVPAPASIRPDEPADGFQEIPRVTDPVSVSPIQSAAAVGQTGNQPQAGYLPSPDDLDTAHMMNEGADKGAGYPINGPTDMPPSPKSNSPAYDRYQELSRNPPQEIKPGLGRRLAAAALGGFTGYVNAGGRVPHIDGEGAMDEILGNNENKRRRKEWEGNVTAAEKAAQEEARATAAGTARTRAEADKMRAQASIDQAKAAGVRAQATADKVAQGPVNKAQQEQETRDKRLKDLKEGLDRWQKDPNDPLAITPERYKSMYDNIMAGRPVHSDKQVTAVTGTAAAVTAGVPGAEQKMQAETDLLKAKAGQATATGEAATKRANRAPVPPRPTRDPGQAQALKDTEREMNDAVKREGQVRKTMEAAKSIAQKLEEKRVAQEGVLSQADQASYKDALSKLSDGDKEWKQIVKDKERLDSQRRKLMGQGNEPSRAPVPPPPSAARRLRVPTMATAP